MSAPSNKTLALWFGALGVWLALSAILEGLGVSAPFLLLLHLLATGVILWRIARQTSVGQAEPFLCIHHNAPSALTPYGVAAAWLSGFGTIGIVAAILLQGGGAFALVAGLIGGMVLVSTVVAPALAATKPRSLPDWFVWRYGVRAGWIAKAVMVLTGLAVLSIQMAFAGLVAEGVFSVPAILVLPVVAALVLLAVLAGGMGTMIPAQAALFLVLGAGVLVPALWLGISQTGIIVPYLAPGALLHEIAVAENSLDAMTDGTPAVAMTLGLTVLLGTLVLPHTLARWPAERDGAAARYFAQRQVTLAVIVIAAVPLFAIAVRAEQLVAALAGGGQLPLHETAVQAVAGGIATLDPPAWLRAALGAGALAAIVAASASATLLVASAVAGDPTKETAGGELSRLRLIAGVAVILSVLIALVMPVDPVAAFLGVLAFAASAYLAPFGLGLMWAGMTARGALAGFVAGAVPCLGLAGFGWGVADGLALVSLALSALASIGVSLAAKEATVPVSLLEAPHSPD